MRIKGRWGGGQKWQRKGVQVMQEVRKSGSEQSRVHPTVYSSMTNPCSLNVCACVPARVVSVCDLQWVLVWVRAEKWCRCLRRGVTTKATQSDLVPFQARTLARSNWADAFIWVCESWRPLHSGFLEAFVQNAKAVTISIHSNKQKRTRQTSWLLFRVLLRLNVFLIELVDPECLHYGGT